MISLSILRRELGLKPEDDELLIEIRQEVIDLWEEQTGRLWDIRTGYIEIVTPETVRTTKIWPSLRPISTITTIEERAARGSTWTTLDSSNYLVVRDHIENISVPWGDRVRITYDGGYSDSTSPLDVRKALVLQAKFMQVRFSDGKIATKSEGFEGGSVGFLEDAFIHPFFRKLAHKKRRKY